MSKLLRDTNKRTYTPREVVQVAIQQMRLARDTGNKVLMRINGELVHKYYHLRNQSFTVLNTGTSVR